MKHKKKAKTLLTLALAIVLSLAAGTSASAIYTVRQLLPDSTSMNLSGNAEPCKDTRKSVVLPENTKDLHVSLDVNNGGVEILPAVSNEIAADYDPQYYDVQLTEQNGKCFVSISGKVAKMGATGFVRLSIPDIKRNMDVHVLNGSFRYDLPENCKDEINITAANSSVHFTSTNRFDGSDISLTAQNKDFIVYQKPVCPDYFTKTDTGFTYKSGAQTNKINISLTGYTSVDFLEAPARNLSGNNIAGQNTITVPVDIAAVRNGAFIWLGAYDFSYGDVINYDVSAGTGNGMATGLASPKDNPLNRVYFTISNKRYNGELKNNGHFTIAAPAKPGQYNLFVHATDGDLTDVKGSITIIKAAQ